MVKASINRGIAVANCGIMDSPREVVFDEIAMLASAITDSPVAGIGFIDSSRQWFKALCGSEILEIKREDSICKYILESKQSLMVEDLTQDSRFTYSPFTQGASPFKFYMGLPIFDNDGFVLGTLCVLDYVPRKLSEYQIFALNALVRQIVQNLSLKKCQQDLGIQDHKLLEMSKSATLGLFSMVMAHEINNPLFIIKTNADLAISVLSEAKTIDESVINKFQLISKMSSRIEKIVGAIKFYSRSGVKDPMERFSVQQMMKELLEIVKVRCLEKNIQFSSLLPENDLFVDCHPSEIAQVLLNLVNNSIDAVSDLSDSWIKTEIKQVGSEIEFSVTDSGAGISQEVASQIMKLFYTTKERSVGTGLGLYISQLIVQEHSGKLFLDSEAPTTRFVFLLPAK
jgi:C4-dicarboxylate-specific signal transduction histidine kinase